QGQMWCVGGEGNVGKWNGSGWVDQGLMGGWGLNNLCFAADGTRWCVGAEGNLGFWNGAAWTDFRNPGGWGLGMLTFDAAGTAWFVGTNSNVGKSPQPNDTIDIQFWFFYGFNGPG